MPLMAGPFNEVSDGPIPLDKKLDANWIKSLYARGVATTYEGWENLQYIGMPIGGIGSGTVYIGGDGKLWVWDIFNEHHEGVVPKKFDHPTLKNPHSSGIRERDGANYINPPAQVSPWHFDQGFAVTVGEGADKIRRTLDHEGFADIRFKGHAPIANISFADPSSDLSVDLEAMTPYIPLDTDRSSYPAVIMCFAFRNNSDSEMIVTAEGWTENPVLQGKANELNARLVNTEYAGETGVGVIASGDALEPSDLSAPADLPGYGSFTLMCLDAEATSAAHPASTPERPVTRITRELSLAPGETRNVRFLVAWHFPNHQVAENKNLKGVKRWYTTKYADAKAVAMDVARSADELVRTTRLWRDTWYDSSLPHWLLERSIIPTNALQTNTSYRFENGRFWAWEGVGCCAGTCTHVWHYAQAVGRLFPDLERDLRKRTDYGIGLQENGAIHFRGEFNSKDAIDGQAGVILRTLREHQVSPDADFLREVWPQAKRALEYLISVDARDGEPDGIPVGEQHNTLDAEWFGKIPVLSSLYIAALRAGEEMAGVVGDKEFAARCHKIFEKGQANILKLFQEDFGFFTQQIDPAHADAIAIGDGCYIDQVMGQWWANQLGLGRLYDGAAIRKALSSLWDYNFCPDVGVLRDSITNPSAKGRLYALAGEAGLVMCTWPKGGRKDDWEKYWQYGYFNECMTGFEYQAAGHMVWESDEQPDLLGKGLAVTRAIHDRYHASKRNPYNEIECSDHYARAMASYGVFLAACGYEYDGPAAHIGFKPRMTDGGCFKSAFTSAEGWGSFEQEGLTAKISLHYGLLTIRTVSLRLQGVDSSLIVETSHGNASIGRSGKDVTLTFEQPITLAAGEALSITL
jgi:uncharacterized protein (DUF608 family)